MTAVDSVVQPNAEKSPIRVQLESDLLTAKSIAYDSHHLLII